MGREHVQRRGRVYYYRRWVPDEVRPVLGLSEMVRSLRTTSAGAARQLAHRLDERARALFTILAGQPQMTPDEVEELIAELVDDWLTRALEEDRRFRRTDPDAARTGEEVFPDLAQEIAEGLEEGRIHPAIQDETDKFVARAGLQLSEDQRQALAWDLSRAQIRLLRHLSEERVGDLLGRPRVDPVGTSSDARARPGAGVTVAEATEAFKRESSRTWSEQYEQAVGTYLSRFTEAIGGASVDIRYVSKQGLLDFRETLRAQGLSEVTVGKHMTAVDRLMKFCMASEWIDRNPAENLPGGFSARDTRAPDEKRERVQDEDLEKILGSAVFAGTHRTDDALDRERYWALLVLTYTGARRREVSQAWAADLIHDRGVACLKIEASDDPEAPKRIKSSASRRTVPLHPDLLELGLLDYVKSVRTKRLFPRLARSQGVLLTKWWAKCRREVKANSKAQIHGLRHRVDNQLKQAGVDEPRIREILGWSHRSLAMGTYGKRFEPKLLLEAVKKIDNRKPLRRLFG